MVKGGQPGVAIAGTSGKSTITAMLGWLLRESGRAATVIGGAGLAHEASNGCLMTGPVDGTVVVEACESDGTLVGYEPTIGLVHNISRDHAELPSLRAQFGAFARNCHRLLVNGGCSEAAGLRAQVSRGVVWRRVRCRRPARGQQRGPRSGARNA